MTVLIGGCLQGWFPLTGLPWNLPSVPGIFVGSPATFDGTSCQAHQSLLVMSLNKQNILVGTFVASCANQGVKSYK